MHHESDLGIKYIAPGHRTLQSIIEKSGLSKERLQLAEQDIPDWVLPTIFYEKIIWIAANKFSKNRCEITHAEYHEAELGENKTALYLCLDFSDKSYEEFARFLTHNPSIIPNELRESFTVSVGFNFGDKGGFTIEKNTISPLTQEEYMNLPIDAKPLPMPYMRALEDYKDLIRACMDHIDWATSKK